MERLWVKHVRSENWMELHPWPQWQQEVVALLKHDFADTLEAISLDDIDWPSWHEYYVQGKSPRAAIDRALERDV
jgi:hypothetical protein